MYRTGTHLYHSCETGHSHERYTVHPGSRAPEHSPQVRSPSAAQRQQEGGEKKGGRVPEARSVASCVLRLAYPLSVTVGRRTLHSHSRTSTSTSHSHVVLATRPRGASTAQSPRARLECVWAVRLLLLGV